MKILVINPGSTSTKLAVYHDEIQYWRKSVSHSAHELAQFSHINEQYGFRKKIVETALHDAGVSLDFDAIIARGGLLKPTPGGVYQVDERIRYDLWNAEREHASNLAGLIASEMAEKIGCISLLADPVVTDELRDIARVSGLPGVDRKSIFHALNSRAVSRKYAAQIQRKYEELNLVVAHLGGGISVSAHLCGRVVDVNNALDGEGPFSPERAGTIPAGQLVDLCSDGKYSAREIKRMLSGKGGLLAHLGTTDVATISRWARAGNMHHKLVLDAMIYTIAKQIGAMHVALFGHTDAILLTGGIAYCDYCVSTLRKWVDGLAPVAIFPGEDEMGALAENALGILRGELSLQHYRPDQVRE